MAEVAEKATRRERFALFQSEEYRNPVNWMNFVLRLSLGWVFLWAGADKLYSEITTGKMATYGYLKFATYGPFAEFFQSMAGNPVIDALLVWGLLLVGIGLMFGVLTRTSAIGGIIIMVLIYLSAWPPAHNPFMDDHIIYALLFGYLAIAGAGRFLGVDRFVEKVKIIQRHRRLTALLG